MADAGPDKSVGINEPVALNGGGSYDIDGTIERYAWTVPGATIPDGQTTSVLFPIAGTYTIKLTVTDNDAKTATDTLIVTDSETSQPSLGMFNDTQGTTPTCEGQIKLVRVNGAPADFPKLKFSEEFNAPLDSTVWNSRYEWSNIINLEAQYYVDVLGADAGAGNWSPFTVADGKLTITAKTTANAGLAWLTNQPYVSGVLNAQHKKSFNGAVGGGLYFETYARPARGNGMWPAFWLYHRTYNNPDPEIDIFEYLGQSIADGNWLKATNKDGVGELPNYNTWDTQYHTYYPGAGGPKGRKVAKYTNQKPADAPGWCGPQSSAGVDFSQAFHKYAVEWTSDHIKWYVDDILLHKVTSAERYIADEDMYIILNLAIGSDAAQDKSWPGAPDTYTTGLIAAGNAKMVVDYVRVYEK